MPSGFFTWSRTAGTNATADSSINWAEGQAPSSVNDSARAMMARLAEYRDDISGRIDSTGTSTNYAITTHQGFPSLAALDNHSITFVFHTTSAANPTLSVDGLPPQPMRAQSGASLSPGAFAAAGIPYTFTYSAGTGEFICEGVGIGDGAISTANIGTGAVTGANIASNTITSANLAAGSVGASAVAPSFFPFNTTTINGAIAQNQTSGSQNIVLKTLAGADPSPGDPVTFLFRDGNGALGDYFVRQVTGTLSIAIPSGQAAGFLSGVPGRLWLLAIENAGAVELVVFNAASLTAGTPVGIANIFPLRGWGIITTQAVSGAASAGIGYSNTARSSRPYVPIGYLAWETGGTMGSAGTWNTAPTRIQTFQPGAVPLPGQIIQQARSSSGAFSSGSGIIPFDTTIPQVSEGNSYLSASIVPSSSANALLVEAGGHFASGSAGGRVTAALFQDSVANAVAVTQMPAIGVNLMGRLSIDFQMQSGIAGGATTFSLRAGNNAGATTFFNAESAGAALYGGALNSAIRITELMA